MTHIFDYSEEHPINRPEGKIGNCRGFPVGHTCLCGERIWKDAPIVAHPEWVDGPAKKFGLDPFIRKQEMYYKLNQMRYERNRI